MTDEQFKQLMDKLEEIKLSQHPPQYIGQPAPYLPRPAYPQPYPWQPYDGLPPHWGHDGGARD